MDVSGSFNELQANPFVILTFIVAPAILTNACAILILSTSNRFARAIDRARELSRQIEDAEQSDIELKRRLTQELYLSEKRAGLLLNSMRFVYFALGGFALGALVSLLGASFSALADPLVVRAIGYFAILVGILAVVNLVAAAVCLIRETRITVGIIRTRIDDLKDHMVT